MTNLTKKQSKQLPQFYIGVNKTGGILKRVVKAENGVSLAPIKRRDARLQSYETKDYNRDGNGRANFQTAMANAKAGLRANTDLRGRDLRNAAKNMVAGNYEYSRPELPQLEAVDTSALNMPTTASYQDNSQANFEASMNARKQQMAEAAKIAAAQAAAAQAAAASKPKAAAKPAAQAKATPAVDPAVQQRIDAWKADSVTGNGETPVVSAAAEPAMQYLYRNGRLQVLPSNLSFTAANEENMYRDQRNNLYYMDPRGVYYKVTGGRGYSGSGDLARNISGQIDRIWDSRPTSAPAPKVGNTYTVPQEWMDEANEYVNGSTGTVSAPRVKKQPSQFYWDMMRRMAESTTD